MACNSPLELQWHVIIWQKEWRITALIAILLTALSTQPAQLTRSGFTTSMRHLHAYPPPPPPPDINTTVPPGSPLPSAPSSTQPVSPNIGGSTCSCISGCCCLFFIPTDGNASAPHSCMPYSIIGAKTDDVCTAGPPPPLQWLQSGSNIASSGGSDGLVNTLDLSGPTGPSWILSNANGSVAGLMAAVPGYALQALRSAGLLGAPAEDSQSDWHYR